jgi:arylsulfatase A-like enzyme
MGVIGASALARPMGVDRGFSVWDERLDHAHEKRHEARAAEVTDRALGALADRPWRGPVFLFAHYYDAHAPYQPPAPYDARWVDPAYRGGFDGSRRAMNAIADAARAGAVDPADLAAMRARYRGEVAYMDAELGRLLATLDDPYVVVFGDHGEALGDVDERPFGHGPDVDPPAVRVPLIVAGPGIPAAVIDTPVALSDVGPTVLALAGVPGGLGAGRDLAPLWSGGAWEPRPVFLEATQPRQAERSGGWNNRAMERGVVRDGWMLLTAPWLGQPPSLRRWGDDTSAVSSDEAAARDALGAALRAWDQAAPPFREDTSDEDIRAGLRALGYLE